MACPSGQVGLSAGLVDRQESYNPDPTKYGKFRPDHVKQLFTGMTTDGERVWIVDEMEGNPLVYEIYEDGQGYWIGSLGSDGVSSGPEEGPTSRFTDDIFMANGVFVTYPDGTQM